MVEVARFRIPSRKQRKIRLSLLAVLMSQTDPLKMLSPASMRGKSESSKLETSTKAAVVGCWNVRAELCVGGQK